MYSDLNYTHPLHIFSRLVLFCLAAAAAADVLAFTFATLDMFSSIYRFSSCVLARIHFVASTQFTQK